MITYTGEYDVVVIGGGTAGSIAAIQAARAGARTALVEASGMLGGTITQGGIAFPGLFYAWGRQIIAGIGWELVEAARTLGNYPLPDFSRVDAPHWEQQLRLDSGVYACILDEACQQAGVDLFFYEFPVAGEPTADGWYVETVGKGPIRRTLICRELIDCTGDAEVVALLGFARERGEECQPGTLYFTLDGYDPATLDADAIQAAYQQAMADGRLQHGDNWRPEGRFIDFLYSRGGNAQHVFAADATTAVEKTSANLRGRASVLRLLRFIRTLPGCEHAYLASMQMETAIRETYRIVGETPITADDYCAGRVYPDAVAHAFYPIDLHTHHGVDIRRLAPGVVPTIPFGALVPRGSQRLLAAGRCVASDRAANSAIRVQAPCMAMGQAVGAAAALAVQLGVPSREVPMTALHALLREHGAIVPNGSA